MILLCGSGNDDMIVPLLSLGASGVISVWSNLDQMVREPGYTAWHPEGSLLPVSFSFSILTWFTPSSARVNPIPGKAALARMGLMEEELSSTFVEDD